jgi:hypothetical protein
MRIAPTLSFLVCCAVAAGCAHRSGKRATAGAISQLKEERERIDPTLPASLTQRYARGAVEGGLDQLSKPENLALLGNILGDATGRALLGASRAPASAGVGGTG